ncbi:MAG TPA: 2-oxoacid:ferredoxin oxidoreductase subunit beta [Clostridia bacterium]|nr:2-oxoacid:ferredoxin oxidoreductase subunit beta [Clostridia bacterium]
MALIDVYTNQVEQTWCPGCGHYSVLRALKIALARLEIQNHDSAIVSGIGCSGRIGGYTKAYGFHGIHGRSLPIAQGIKLANRKLTVIAAGGDGDGFAIGTGHAMHAIKRNIDITYLLMNNQVYGLTKGHTSPLSELNFVTKSTPLGQVEDPLKPSLLALSAGGSFIAQGFSGEQEKLIELIMKGILHKGFSLINIFSPCVTFNPGKSYAWFRENLVSLDESRNTSDRGDAFKACLETDGLFTGLLYENNAPDYQSRISGENKTALINLDIKNTRLLDGLIEEFM